MVRPGPKTDKTNLLRVWKNAEEELPFSIILERAKKELNITKQTVINYLNYLTKEEFLEKKVDKMRNTFYKIKINTDFYKFLLKNEIETTEDDEFLVFLVIVFATMREKKEHNPLLVYEEALKIYKNLKENQKAIIDACSSLLAEQKMKEMKSKIMEERKNML